MTPMFALRLCLDLLAGGLLVAGHQVFNRRWYGRAPKARHDVPSLFNVVVTAALVGAMVPLLVTSAMLATFLPEWVSTGTAGTARQAHVLAAYWAFVIVAIHLGLRWPMIMGFARRLFGIDRPSWLRTGVLRLATAAIAALGLWSLSALQLGSRLTNQVSLDWWNFDQSVLGFFGHSVAAAGLLVAAGHYATLLMRPGRSGSGTAIAQHVNQQGQRG